MIKLNGTLNIYHMANVYTDIDDIKYIIIIIKLNNICTKYFCGHVTNVNYI